MVKVFIMRGLPGAGKTTWIRNNLPDAFICSADNYFLDKEGNYKFDNLLISEAHESCLKCFAEILTSHEDEAEKESLVIVVDNTAIRAWEISPYYNLAKAYGHDVKVVHIKCDSDLAHSRNIHEVPLERVEKMDEGLNSETLPLFWNVEVVEPVSDH
ncbi:MAG: ATP-binding protein [Candidatus Aegiribacteria sp.]|nr:ATP-binding protein [Candidatus Aegiribacteria sp.]